MFQKKTWDPTTLEGGADQGRGIPCEEALRFVRIQARFLYIADIVNQGDDLGLRHG